VRLPAIYQWPEITDEGGLIGYGPHITQIYGEILSRQLAALLRGTKPADIPAEQPTKYDLAINLKTAKTLGLAIPHAQLARPDESSNKPVRLFCTVAYSSGLQANFVVHVGRRFVVFQTCR